MSDNVASVEMEDVLSSIRRLVRDEVKTRAAAAENEKQLLLSQSLRVVSDKAVDGDIASAFGEPDMARNPDTPSEAEQIEALSALEATIAELEAAVSGTKGFEPEPHQEQDIYNSAPAFFKSSLADGDLVNDDTEEAEKAALRRDLLEPVAANLTFVPPAADDIEKDEKPQTPAPLQLMPESLVQDIPVIQHPDSIGPASTHLAEETDEELEDEEILLDEDTLRIMVQSIVRTELQGALGEAITQNIRRLIRREIHSYFDVQDSL